MKDNFLRDSGGGRFQDDSNAVHLLSMFLFLWSSLVVQSIKSLPAVRETWVQSPGREDLLEKEMTTHCSILA